MQWVELMRFVSLVAVMVLSSIGMCSAQGKGQQTTRPNKPSESKTSKSRNKPPKSDKDKAKDAPQTGTKLHPEQERSYTQADRAGAVRKP